VPRTRRSIIRAGVTGFAGITLAGMLRAADRAGGDTGRSVIHVHLDGGPPQMDTIDMKPAAPAEVRGEFMPISSAVPGIQVCELLPGIAGVADRIAFVRSVVGSTGQHDAFQCQSGFDAMSLRSLGGWPALGYVLSRLWGRPGDQAPTFVDCMQGRGLARNSARPGFLGAVSFQDVCATLYHLLGLDPSASLLTDLSGRPHPLVETGRVIRPLV